jgi:hypothetical protein
MASFRVTDSGVRLRSAPGLNSDTLTMLSQGTRADGTDAATQDADGHTWRQVTVNGQTGWIAVEFLQESGNGQGGANPGRQFDPSIPDERQRQDWTCSIRSTMWLLKSIGIDVSPEDAQDAMSPRFVSSADGLLDSSGAGIVTVLREVWGVNAFNQSVVSFDDVAGWAGNMPVAIGGRAWVHWTAVRGVDGNGNLVLANPAGTGGGRWGLATLNRQQFADLGSFSAVVIPL